jgi:hypothetical protein
MTKDVIFLFSLLFPYFSASNCVAAVLTEGVMASPLKELYRIGEKVTLSCPPGKQILGETEVICDPSLLFSPSPESVRCIEGMTHSCNIYLNHYRI